MSSMRGNMSTAMQSAVDYYKHILTLNDKRVEKWFLMEDPTPSICVAASYLAFCFAAPKVLRGRSFNVDGYVRVYNLVMVAVSFYLARELGSVQQSCPPSQFAFQCYNLPQLLNNVQFHPNN